MLTIRRKIVDDIFADVIDSDFNPDIVHLGLLDSFDEGRVNGMILTGIPMGFIIACLILSKRKKKVTEPKEKESD